MTIIIAILIYLQLIVSPGTYTQAHIDTLQTENQAKIDAIQQDDAQMKIINQKYVPQAENVIVINPGQDD